MIVVFTLVKKIVTLIMKLYKNVMFVKEVFHLIMIINVSLFNLLNVMKIIPKIFILFNNHQFTFICILYNKGATCAKKIIILFKIMKKII